MLVARAGTLSLRPRLTDTVLVLVNGLGLGHVEAEDGVVGDRRVEEVDERDGVEHGHLELAPAERVALLVLCAIVLLCMVAL